MPIYYLDSGSIDNLEISSSLLVSGSFALSGSLRISEGGITGSLLGTSSWSQNSVTASFVTTAQTASFVTTAQTASYVLQAVSSSFATTASFAVSASWAPGGGSVGGSGTANRVTKFTAATTLGDSSIFDNGSNIQITSSNIVVSGSDTFVAFTSSFFGIYQTASQYNGNVELQVKNASVGDVNAQSIVNVLGDSNTGLSIGTNTSGYVPLPGSDNLADAKDSFVSNNTQGGVLHIYNTSTGSTSAVWIYSQPDAFPLSPKVVIQVTGSEAFIDTLVATGSLFGTSSWAVSASWAPGGTGTSDFPYTGSAIISGSLVLTGSFNTNDGIIAQTVTASFTGSLTGALIGTASWANNAITSSYPILITGSSQYSILAPLAGQGANVTSSVYIGSGSGFQATGAFQSIFMGEESGWNAGGARQSVFLGSQAGYRASGSFRSNFIGLGAGTDATNADNSNFFGLNSGLQARNADFSNFLGSEAGYTATNAKFSNFFGAGAGYAATNASQSNFLGVAAGEFAYVAENSNFIGNAAGSQADSASYSNFIGAYTGYKAKSSSYSTFLGYQAGANYLASNYLLSNNIIIGTNISLPARAKDAVNIGAIIFATGSYSDFNAPNPFTGSVGNGRVGINVVSPNYNLDVSGSGNYTNGLTVTGSLRAPSITGSIVSASQFTGSLFGTASYALVALTAPAFPFTGSAEVSGSFKIIGSGSNILVVSGTQGALLSVSEKTAADTRLFTVSSASINLLTVNDNKSTRISGSLIVTGSITGSLFGTASFATTSSYAITASFALNAGGGSGTGFPFEGVAIITGSIAISSGSGIFAPTVTASESLTAGDFINIAAGGVRKASNDNTGKQAHGFVTESVAANASVVVFYGGLNTNVSGLTAGSRYFLGTSGGETLTPPTTAGQLSQEVGVAVSSTAILVNFGPAIVT